MKLQYLELGKVQNTHGVRGELRVEPWCDTPDLFDVVETVYLKKDGKEPYRVVSWRPHKHLVLLTLAGVGDVDTAARLKNRILYVERDAIADTLPEGKHFIAEMLGCEVRNADDESIVYGKLTDVFNRGANNVWEIRKGDKEYLMPDIPGIVVSVDIEKGVALVKPIPGIFDDAEEVR